MSDLYIGSDTSSINLGIKSGGIIDWKNSLGSEGYGLTKIGNRLQWSPIGGTDFIRKQGGTDYTTDLSSGTSTWKTIASITLPSGLWIVQFRARFTPTSSGNHRSFCGLTTDSTGEAWGDSRWASGTHPNQHNSIEMYTTWNYGTSTYYLRGTSDVAGSWIRTDSNSLIIRAAKLA